MDKRENEGEFLYHTNCTSCGSRDANAVYSNGTSYCFRCETWSNEKNEGNRTTTQRKSMSRDVLVSGDYVTLRARGLTETICKLYNYTKATDMKGKVCQAATYYNSDKEPIAQKLRYVDKTFKFIGAPKEALMFGQQLWGSGGKKLTITEGEIDALSVAQAFDGKYPVVSISNGAQSAKKEVTKHLDWISSFEEICLWFDNDEAGRKAIEEVANVLPLDKVKIITHPEYKDANEVLINVGKSGLVKTFYNAESYKPDGFVSPEDLLEDALKPIDWGLDWCYDSLTQYSYGRRYGEIVSVGAGVSVGKTDFIMQQIAFDLKAGRQVATFMLEQSKVETLLRVCGKIDGTFYHLPDVEYDKDKLRESIIGLNSTLHIYDNFGKIDWETIKGKIRSAVHSYGCKLFYIDNLTALNAHADDERRNLDGLMEEIASLAKELDIWILLVSHLNPPKSGPSHESGGKVEQGQFTGSRAIMRWSQFMLGIERNTTHPEEVERCKGLVRCIKDRFSGKATGKTVSFIYDNDTGMTLESEDMFDLEVADEERDF